MMNQAHRTEASRLSILIERHFNSEVKMIEKLEELNEKLTELAQDKTIKSLDSAAVLELENLTNSIGNEGQQLREKRSRLIELINRNLPLDAPRLSLRQFIQRNTAANQQRLEETRQRVINRLSDVHAKLIGNQAVYFYNFDFYKNMLCSLLQCNFDKNNYRADGKQNQIPAGNVYRKAV